ncbi:hypothetical protein BGZ72_005674 [Mortierella alpina]|nr:hypothetical protein BGZ72_005674 [Mortierella alpina]
MGDANGFVVVNEVDATAVMEAVAEVPAEPGDCDTPAVIEDDADLSVAPDEEDDSKGTEDDVDLSETADEVGVPAVTEDDTTVSVTEDEIWAFKGAEVGEIDASTVTADDDVLPAEPDVTDAPPEDGASDSALVDEVDTPAVLESDADWPEVTDKLGASACVVADDDIAVVIKVVSPVGTVLDFDGSVIVELNSSVDAVLVDVDS